MIFGIGTDIVRIDRMAAALQRHGTRFADRILAVGERPGYLAARDSPRFVAKRFAVKEAFSKAWGTGIGAEIGWHDIEVTHDAKGKPLLVASDALNIRLDAAHVVALHVSISDEIDHVIAFVVIESTSG